DDLIAHAELENPGDRLIVYYTLRNYHGSPAYVSGIGFTIKEKTSGNDITASCDFLVPTDLYGYANGNQLIGAFATTEPRSFEILWKAGGNRTAEEGQYTVTLSINWTVFA
ncbi:MAG: hypothetical protein FWE62_02870, partial [Firmicutes bacterium]|nr:hypothetical protein [Bacillota bacterium]